MVQVVMTAEQAKLVSETSDSIEMVDSNGEKLGTLLRPPTQDDIRIAGERISRGGKRHTTKQVIDHLRSLDQS